MADVPEKVRAAIRGAIKHRTAATYVLDQLDAINELTAPEIAFIDGVTAGTAAASKAVVLSSGGDVTWVDGGDVALGTTTGTKIGTAVTQKLGFFNATPVVQPSGAAQAALTDSTGGSADGTLAAVTDTSMSDQSGTINNNFTELYTLLTAIRTALVNLGVIKGAA